MTVPAPPQSEVRLLFSAAEELRFLSAEGPVADLLGYSPQDFAAGTISFFSRVHSDDRDLIAAISANENKKTLMMPLRVRHRDGRIRCLRIQSCKHKKGKLEQLELKLQTVAAAQKSDDIPVISPQLKTFLENTDEAVFLKDCNHAYVAWSPAFGRLLLRPRPEGLAGLTDYDLLPEEQADRFYEAEKRVFAEPRPQEHVTEIMADGCTHWFYAHYFPLIEGGQTTGLFAISRNLTERLRAEERFDPHDHSEGALRAAQTGTYIMDIRRGVFATSSALDAIFGINNDFPHDLAGWQQLMHPDDSPRVQAYLDSVLAVRGRVFNREYRIIRHKDGVMRWVQGIGRVDRDAQGNPMLLRGTVHDITDRKLTEVALRETRDRLQLFIEHAPAALAMFDRDMRYLAVSRRWLEIRRMDHDILGRCHYDVATDIPERWKEAHRRGLAGEALRGEEDKYERADGTVQWLRWEILPWHTGENEVGGFVLFLEDITESKQAEERLKLAASVFAHATEAIMVMDLEARVLEVNESFTRLTGYERESVLGQVPGFLRSTRQSDEFYAEMWKSMIVNGRWRGEIWGQAKDGHQFAAIVTLTTVFQANNQPQYHVALLSDITHIKEQEQKLEHVTHFDPLTGLPNRAQIAERLRVALADALQSRRTVAIVHLDVDNFKELNDRLGREVADQLLIALSTNLGDSLSEADTLGRLSGDEFLAILPNLSGVDAASPAMERLLAAVARPFTVGDTTVQVSATAGASFYPQPQEVDAEQLLRQADQAMYEAKLAGKARIQIFDPVEASSVRGRYEELHRIRQGLQAGEFVLYYQPKVNMATGELIGAEALLRWQHPERGLLAPAAFLPVIEEDDIAIEVGAWVFDTALSQVETWAASGQRIPVSVNVSARHLQQPDFMQQLEALLQAHPKAQPGLLELELLETSTLHDMPHVSRIIERCTRMGISVAIDDFGTGYSSLTYLKRLPAHALKIDQSFVRDMLDDPDDLAILQGVLGLATAFRRTAIAEGVETIEHGVLLLKLGCESAQGYGIARPMPAGDLLKWSAAWRPDPRWAEVRPVSPFDWPLMIAEVELRQWTRYLASYLAGRRATPPELDPRRCRFGTWLDEEKAGPRGALPVFARIDSLHEHSHDSANRAVKLYEEDGPSTEALSLSKKSAAALDQIRAELAHLYASTNGAAAVSKT